MSPARLDKLTWSLIFGGVVLAILGFFLDAGLPTASLGLKIAGAVLAAVGFVMIGVRAQPAPGPKTPGDRS